MRGFSWAIQALSKNAVRNVFLLHGLNPRACFKELAATGVCRLSATTKIVYSRRRYRAVDEGSVGGENLASILPEEMRNELPAAQPDADGTTYEQRKEVEREAAAEQRVRLALIRG